VRVVVDWNICKDHGQCVIAAPVALSLDENGKLVLEQVQDDTLRSAAEDAADVCPEQAITIED
jgi:ferredoxin